MYTVSCSCLEEFQYITLFRFNRKYNKNGQIWLSISIHHSVQVQYKNSQSIKISHLDFNTSLCLGSIVREKIKSIPFERFQYITLFRFNHGAMLFKLQSLYFNTSLCLGSILSNKPNSIVVELFQYITLFRFNRHYLISPLSIISSFNTSLCLGSIVI